MPFLDPITKLINDSIKSSTLADSRFQKGSWNQIANLIPRDDEGGAITIPTVILDMDGSEKEIGFDDRYTFTIYHRVESLSHDDGDPSGDDILVKETANMVAVVFGDRNLLMMPQEQLISGVIGGFPIGVSMAQKLEWNLSAVEIETGAVNNNPRAVWSSEMGDVKFALKPNHILFSINYTIMTEYLGSCLNIC